MMRTTKTFCDVCGKETSDSHVINMKWCNEKDFKEFDICVDCKNKSELLITEKERENERATKSNDSFLGLLRIFFNKKK